MIRRALRRLETLMNLDTLDHAIEAHLRAFEARPPDPDPSQPLGHPVLERLCHRRHIGMDEAEEQLHACEERNPSLLFERS